MHAFFKKLKRHLIIVNEGSIKFAWLKMIILGLIVTVHHAKFYFPGEDGAKLYLHFSSK
jgi:hypothetical protein